MEQILIESKNIRNSSGELGTEEARFSEQFYYGTNVFSSKLIIEENLNHETEITERSECMEQIKIHSKNSGKTSKMRNRSISLIFKKSRNARNVVAMRQCQNFKCSTSHDYIHVA